MEMVIGGAFQGKAAFAEKMYPGISWVKGNEISREELFSARGVVGFHEFIKKRNGTRKLRGSSGRRADPEKPGGNSGVR